MGIKQTNIQMFLEPESMGLIQETALSFLKRNADPNWLLTQLQSLANRGDLVACDELIQLIIREGHSLADCASLYLLQARLAYQKEDDLTNVEAWLEQARLLDATAVQTWQTLLIGRQALKEGDYSKGVRVLETLLDDPNLSDLAAYELAYHFFWKNVDAAYALRLLEDVVVENPSFFKAWSCLGFVYNRLGIKDKAQEAFGHCLALDSNPERVKIYKQQLAS